MLTSEQIKKIKAEVSPYIRRQMEDGAIIAGFRGVVAAAGGDWAALKAVIKAEIQDEDAGDGKKIGKVAEKAEWTRIYLDMLGIAPNMNEENIIEDHDPETGEVLDTSSTAARKDVSLSEARGQAISDKSKPAGTQAPPVETNLPATTEGSGSTGGTDVGGGGETDAREGAPADEAEPTQVEASSVYINPDCAEPDTCQFASKSYLCSGCNSARAERLVAQRRGKQ